MKPAWCAVMDLFLIQITVSLRRLLLTPSEANRSEHQTEEQEHLKVPAASLNLFLVFAVEPAVC